MMVKKSGGGGPGPNAQMYSLAELKGAPKVPPGVNPQARELWLKDDEFEATFGVTKEQWHKMPAWKRGDLKQKNGFP